MIKRMDHEFFFRDAEAALKIFVLEPQGLVGESGFSGELRIAEIIELRKKEIIRKLTKIETEIEY